MTRPDSPALRTKPWEWRLPIIICSPISVSGMGRAGSTFPPSSHGRRWRNHPILARHIRMTAGPMIRVSPFVVSSRLLTAALAPPTSILNCVPEMNSGSPHRPALVSQHTGCEQPGTKAAAPRDSRYSIAKQARWGSLKAVRRTYQEADDIHLGRSIRSGRIRRSGESPRASAVPAPLREGSRVQFVT
jgi:hypothetical protein